MDAVTEHVQSVSGKPFVRILLGKQSGKVGERQSHPSRITTDSQLTYHSLKALTCSNIKPRQPPITPHTGSAGSSGYTLPPFPSLAPGLPRHWGHSAEAKLLQRQEEEEEEERKWIYFSSSCKALQPLLPSAAVCGTLGCGIVFLGKHFKGAVRVLLSTCAQSKNWSY